MSKTTKPAAQLHTGATSTNDDVQDDYKSPPLTVDQQQVANGARQDFLAAAANMSWQLALVVLIPLIGGYKLDIATNNAPLFTIVGFIIAMVGMAAVTWRQLQLFSPKITAATKTSKTTLKGHRS